MWVPAIAGTHTSNYLIRSTSSLSSTKMAVANRMTDSQSRRGRAGRRGPCFIAFLRGSAWTKTSVPAASTGADRECSEIVTRPGGCSEPIDAFDDREEDRFLDPPYVPAAPRRGGTGSRPSRTSTPSSGTLEAPGDGTRSPQAGAHHKYRRGRLRRRHPVSSQTADQVFTRSRCPDGRDP